MLASRQFITNKDSDINLFVYLTPISNIALNDLEEPESASKEFIHINYQSILDYLLEPILKRDTSDRTKIIINEYIKSLSQPTMEKYDKEHKPDLIMALGTEERALLNNFWEKNQKLIMAALYARSIDDEVDEEGREAFSKVIESEKILKIGEFFRISFRELHKRNLLDEAEIENLQDEEYSKRTFNVNYPVLRSADKGSLSLNEEPRYYAKEKFCGNYFLTSQWFKKDWIHFNKWLDGIYAKNGISRD